MPTPTPNPNITIVLTLSLKLSWHPHVDLWSCEDQHQRYSTKICPPNHRKTCTCTYMQNFHEYIGTDSVAI